MLDDAAPPAPPRPDSASPTRSLSVTAQLRDAILAGGIGPGEKLNEIRLSARLGVSRTPLRAALQALAAEGLLEYAPNRGYAVRVFPLSETLDAFEIRAVLEGVAARLAAERGPDAAVQAEFARSLAAGDAIVARALTGALDIDAFRDANIAFHDAVTAAAGNRRLPELVRLCATVPTASTRRILALDATQLRRFHDDHHRISDAIIAGQGWRAEALMREHVLALQAVLLRALPEGARRG